MDLEKGSEDSGIKFTQLSLEVPETIREEVWISSIFVCAASGCSELHSETLCFHETIKVCEALPVNPAILLPLTEDETLRNCGKKISKDNRHTGG